MQTKARLETASAKRYLGQFTKHFAHKLPVELADDLTEASVTFGTGICQLHANETTLQLDISASRAEDIASLQEVVSRHLVRFAFREPVQLTWVPAA